MKIRGDLVVLGIVALVVFAFVPALASSAEPSANNSVVPSGTVPSHLSRVPPTETAIADLLSWYLRTNTSLHAPQVAGHISQKTVYNHFYDIAFSEMNYEIMRLEAHNRPIIVSSYGSFTSEDKTLVEDFIRKFNQVSASLKINPVVKTNELSADFWINIFPEKTLQQLSYDMHGNRQLNYTEYEGSILSDNILYRADTGTAPQVFVSDDLTGDKRRHYILRAMTYSLGLTGEATDPTSFFYPGNTEQVDLTETDWRAIRLMYGPVMARNLTIGEAMSRLNT